MTRRSLMPWLAVFVICSTAPYSLVAQTGTPKRAEHVQRRVPAQTTVISGTSGSSWPFENGERPEFAGLCAYNLTLGRFTATSCSLRLRQKGKIYCFESGVAKGKFLADLDSNVEKARKAFDTIDR